MNRRFFLSIFSILFAFVAIAQAQVPTPAGGLELTPSTNSPLPGQTIKITARSYSIDINSAKISWYVDGKASKSGAGITTLDVTAPVLGKKKIIEVIATDSAGISLRSSITIGSGSIDLIVENDGHVFPFFKGKLVPSYQNTVTVIAVPHIANSAGTEYDPSSLVYQWKRNGKVLESQSGYGKQSISIDGDIVPRPYDLSVSVWPRDNSLTIDGALSIEAGVPDINFYVDDPQYGPLFNRAIRGSVRIGGNKETTVLAVPFGFNKPQNGTGDLELGWGINGTGVPSLAGKESIVLRSPDDSSGNSNVQLNIRNTDRILQGATKSFSVSFSSAPKQESVSF